MWNDWKSISLLVCVFAMVREIRPIEPFFTTYLESLNFTLTQVNEEIYAVGTYSCLVLAAIILLITDYFRYKPLIIADGIAGIFTYVLLLETPSLFRIQMEQVCFGFFYSSEVAFTTYLYAKVDDKQYYQKITSLVKASMLFGRFLSGLIGQVIISTELLNKLHLVYISIFSTSFVTIWALFLPKVEHSLYFYRNNESTNIHSSESSNTSNGVTILNNVSNGVDKTTNAASINEVKQIMLNDFRCAYSNIYVAKKCFWWIVALTGHIIVATYIQVLWEDVNHGENNLMNGAVESLHTICGATGAYAVGYLNCDWKKFSDSIYTVGTLVLALLLLFISYNNSLWILYVIYITYGTIYQILMTITTSEVAKYVKPDSYGLVFGFNFFTSLLLISIFTLLFIQGLIVIIGTRMQIFTVSMMFVSMSVIFLIFTIKNKNKTSLPIN